MRLQIASDLHLEFLQDLFLDERLIFQAIDADILVLSGDTVKGVDERASLLLLRLQ